MWMCHLFFNFLNWYCIYLTILWKFISSFKLHLFSVHWEPYPVLVFLSSVHITLKMFFTECTYQKHLPVSCFFTSESFKLLKLLFHFAILLTSYTDIASYFNTFSKRQWYSFNRLFQTSCYFCLLLLKKYNYIVYCHLPEVWTAVKDTLFCSDSIVFYELWTLWPT